MGSKYIIEANRAGFYFLKKEGEQGTVMPLGIDIGKAVDAAREFVNLKGDGSTLDEGNAVPSHLDVVVRTKQHFGKKLGEVLRDDPGFLVWFYLNFDMARNKKPENLKLWKTLDELAKDSRSSFHKSLNIKRSKPKNKKHVGRVGDELIIPVTVANSFAVKGKFHSDPLKIILRDEEGNHLWMISACRIAKILDLSKSLQLPQDYHLKCEIIEHGEYKGTPETKIKPKELIVPGNPSIGLLLHFEYSNHYNDDVIKEKLKNLSILTHYFVKEISLSKVVLNTKGEGEQESGGQFPKITYKKGYAYFTAIFSALVNHAELREIIDQPLKFNLDGISLTKLESVPLLEQVDG